MRSPEPEDARRAATDGTWVAGPGVPAGWAVYGKTAGTADDYAVLRSSTAYFSRADYDGILRRFVPGTPPPRPQRFEAAGLPWATISYAPLRLPQAGPGVGAGGVPVAAEASVLGIAVCDWTDVTDGAGRPVAATSYLCAPFGALAAVSLGYEDLYLALRWDPAVAAALGPGAVGPHTSDEDRTSIPVTDGAGPAGRGAVPLGPLPGLDASCVAQVLEADPAMFRLAAGVAALLLCQPVALLGGRAAEPGSRITERLRFLDAIVALLPYGQRARLVVSTWADSGSTHRIRLAYTDRARPGDATVTLAGPNAQASLPALPRGAREYFSLLVDLHSRHGMSVERIVGHLGERVYRQAHRIADPRHALLCLADLLGPSFFATRFRATPAPRGTPAEVVSEVVALLRAQRQRQRLLVGASSAASDAAVLDVLAARADGDAIALELIRHAIDDDLRDVGADIDHAGLLAAAPHAVGWIGWLARAAPLEAAVRPFARMIAGPIDPTVLSALAERGRALRGDSRYVLAHVRLSRLTGRRRSLDQQLWQWLTAAAATGTLARSEREVWARELSLDPVSGAAAEARRDLLRLLLGAGPVEPLRTRMLSPDRIGYRTDLVAGYLELISRYATDTRRLMIAASVMNGLATSLDRGGWPDDAAAVDDTLKLLARLAEAPHWISPGLRTTLIVYLSTTPRLRRRSDAEQRWRDLLAVHPADPAPRQAR